MVITELIRSINHSYRRFGVIKSNKTFNNTLAIIKGFIEIKIFKNISLNDYTFVWNVSYAIKSACIIKLNPFRIYLEQTNKHLLPIS